ncbi:DNA repair protein complementing XP-A cells homolog [Pomacea canaliculata]|uniref:DNA repair protein complementing XP-A cells homolog n=1 Tax=Pomacea canaliculata TaxID=400727 RepID=UPI000D73266D|nr:DNA repair protein complementing XP-A cells homolog [Pomacea canaliculata]
MSLQEVENVQDSKTVSSAAEEKREEKMTDAQRARVERNRQKAILLKQARLANHPYGQDKDRHKVKAPPRTIDTGAGFFIEEDEEDQIQREIKHPLGPIIPQISERLLCEDCGKEFLESYLHNHFDAFVCDLCRENKEKYELITKTDAKNKYLLKDADFDVREPPLKFILRKNPHNPRWGEMRLYLELQVQARAVEVWGDEEKLEEARDQRTANKEKAKQKKFDKRVKALRMAVRSSLWRKEMTGHEHVYGEETYNDDDDEYSKTCTTCGHVMTYEKM